MPVIVGVCSHKQHRDRVRETGGQRELFNCDVEA